LAFNSLPFKMEKGSLPEGMRFVGQAMESRFAIQVPVFGDIAESMFSKQRTLPFCDCFCCGNSFLPALNRKGNSHLGGGTEQNCCIQTDPNPAGHLQKELYFLADSAYFELPDYSPADLGFIETSRSRKYSWDLYNVLYSSRAHLSLSAHVTATLLLGLQELAPSLCAVLVPS